MVCDQVFQCDRKVDKRGGREVGKWGRSDEFFHRNNLSGTRVFFSTYEVDFVSCKILCVAIYRRRLNLKLIVLLSRP